MSHSVISLWILWTDLSLTKVGSECMRSLVKMFPLQLGCFSPLQVATHISLENSKVKCPNLLIKTH